MVLAAARAQSMSWSVTTLVSRRAPCLAHRTTVGGECDGFLPDLEVPDVGCHGQQDGGGAREASGTIAIAYSRKKVASCSTCPPCDIFHKPRATLHVVPTSRPHRMATDTTLRPGEIKDILLREIEAADLHELDVEEVGTVLEVKDGIARIYGLQKAMAGEMLEVTSSETGNKVTALALNLEEDNIGAVVLGDYLQLKEGDEVRRTSRVLEVPVGPELVGRVVDALGRPIDGMGDINAKTRAKSNRTRRASSSASR